jgi:hypothetical protein
MIRLRTARKGFVLMVVAIALVALIASLGLAYDIGRMYIAKNEAQNFVDAAALAAVLELDGTSEGIARARSRVANDPNRWNYAQTAFANSTVLFAKAEDGPWESIPLTPKGYGYASVSTTVPVPLTFLPMINSTSAVPGGAFFLFTINSTADVKASSNGAQELQSGFKDGLFPFSPFAHDRNAGPHFGLTPGQMYTLRWASNFNATGNNDTRMCPGDRTDAMRELARAGTASDRGFIESTSSDIIRQSIVYDYQSVFREIGDAVNMTGGVKQDQKDSLMERVLQDSNHTAATFAEYQASGSGNGRRVVGVPINSGAPDFIIVQIAAFFLSTADEYASAQGGNMPFCAEYIGSWVKGSTRPGVNETGAYVVKLVK